MLLNFIQITKLIILFKGYLSWTLVYYWVNWYFYINVFLNFTYFLILNFCRNWATPSHPALEGTQCSSNSQCYQGQCKSINLIPSIDTVQPQPSTRLNSIQSNLVQSQRNYIPILNTSNALFFSKSRIKMLNKQEKLTTAISSSTEQSTFLNAKKSINTIKEPILNESNKLNRKTYSNDNEFNKSSFFEDIRRFARKVYYFFV